jgi:hypothetical protein
MLLLLFSGDVTGAKTQSLAFTTDDVTVAIAQTAGHSQAIAFTTGDVTVSIAQTAGHPQSLAVTTDDVTVSISQTVASASKTQALAFTTDDVSVSIQQVGPSTIGGGGVPPWNPYRQAGETEEQKQARREAQGIIAKAKLPNADIPALFEQAKGVSAFLQSDIDRLNRQAQEFQALINQRKTVKRAEALAMARNDELALKQLYHELIQIQLQAEFQAQQIEELDIAFMVVMLAAM